MFLLVKLLSATNTFTLVFYRAAVQIVLSLSGLLREGVNDPLIGPPGVRSLLVLRAGFGAAAVCAWFYGCRALPLSDAVTLQFATPAFAAATAVFLVGERWTPPDMCGAIVCLLGVALIARPTWMFGTAEHGDDTAVGGEEANHDSTPPPPMRALGVLVTTLGSISAGLAYVYVRKIGNRASATTMVLYYGYVSIPISLIGSRLFEGTWNIFSGGRTSPFSAVECVLILFIGILGHMAQWLLNAGLQRENAATGTLATCTQIVWTYIFELAFLHEALNRWSLIGTGLILGDMFVVALVKVRGAQSKNRPASEPMRGAKPTEHTAFKANQSIWYDHETLLK
eukprot:CAMPEP_0172548152 /NCGR_PEP_ID=MMETSP1067-20121228/17529_1 /TAXON_ID=265564 ORGANISM="Thalassiosira punctigera, Strain Tpunct2005C2" /NCGR_SAMPLE_ID=MMETSP1067 /ASSEMBLY_ACC=CAM_ASM_000444 /LENGTH=339 /DNA_ID=CAMNT_0013335347 /DNA_START=425 /DNA_END=1444 /DNA_ORIENTATION=+